MTTVPRYPIPGRFPARRIIMKKIRMDLVQRQAAPKCFCNVEPIAKFVAGQVISPANVMFCLFRYPVRPGEKYCPTTKSTKLTKSISRDRSALFVSLCLLWPFPAMIPLPNFANASNYQSVFWCPFVSIRVHSWFVVPLRGQLFFPPLLVSVRRSLARVRPSRPAVMPA